MKLTVHATLGHSPQKAFLRDFLVAFAEANSEYILDHVTDDIVWEVVGDARIVGKAAFMLTVERLNPNQTVELTLSQIITHGKEAAVSGDFVLDNGERYAFADIYIFKNTKGNAVQMIKSFNIKLG